MAGRKLRRIMTACARKAERIHVHVMLSREITVIFGRTEGMTGSTLRIRIDRTGNPRRCRLPAVTAHRGARTIGIMHCSTAFCVIGAQDHYVDDAVNMILRSGSRAAVAGIAYVRNLGKRIVRRMRCAPVVSGEARRGPPVTGCASRQGAYSIKMTAAAGHPRNASPKVFPVALLAGGGIRLRQRRMLDRDPISDMFIRIRVECALVARRSTPRGK